ncbi:MAG: hypothetical protein IJ856_05210 [Candidatus Methanomethylophilaceae archaeon]|nr:hypothetical protein [Candidatus Methanomethylophilaceae archaeon]
MDYKFECRLTIGGGISGGHWYLTLLQKRDGSVRFSYDTCKYVGAPTHKGEVEMSEKQVDDVRKLCDEYGAFDWGPLEKEGLMILDAPTTDIFISDGDRYVAFDSEFRLPDGGYDFIDRLYDLLMEYVPADPAGADANE